MIQNTDIAKELKELLSENISNERILELINKKERQFNGKLYKYFSFSENDSNHSIDNLKNNIIYFSKPEVFNDPFDCYLGISPNELLIQYLLPFFNKEINFTGENAELLKMITQEMIFGDANKYNDNIERNSALKLIKFLFSTPQILEVVKEIKEGKEISQERINACFAELIKSPNFLREMMPLLIDPNLNNEIRQQLTNKNNLHKIMITLFENSEALKLLLPNESIDSETAGFIPIIANKEKVIDKIVSLAKMTGQDIGSVQQQLTNFNNIVDSEISKLKDKINKFIGITCFTKRSDNILMWSHYANKHTGFCVEYDYSKIKNLEFKSLLFPVIYSNTRASFPLSMLDFSDINNIKVNNDIPSIIKLIEALLTKSTIWEYEEEWRAIGFLNKLNNQCVIEDCIIKIFLGANISSDNQKSIESIAKEKNIPVFRYKIDNEEYKLNLINLE